MRRRKLLAVLAGLAVVVTAGAVVLWPQHVRVTKENYDHIQAGMTRAEVEAILGPPGDYRTCLGETGGEAGYGNMQIMARFPDPATDLGDTPSNWSREVRSSVLWARWMSDSFAIFIGIDDSGGRG